MIILLMIVIGVILNEPIFAGHVPNELIVKTRQPIRFTQNNQQNSTAVSMQSKGIFDGLSVVSVQPIGGQKETNHLMQSSGQISNAVNLYHVQLTDSDITQALDVLSAHPDVIYAQRNYIYETCVVPNDTDYQAKQTQLSLLDVEAAWDVTQGSSNVIIAVIDTGVNVSHNDLKNRIWTNSDDATFDDDDNDNNGYKDDKNGWDFVLSTPNMTDPNGHGTHVAGIAAAETNNNKGIAGVAYRASIMPLRAGNAEGKFQSLHILQAIQYATNNGAHIVNMSFGGTITDNAVEDAIKDALNKNVVLVAAAGNTRQNIDVFQIKPASYAGVIAVSATDATGEFASEYSNFGSSIDVAAPGTAIYSTYTGGANTYQTLTGTSMAAPHVAGLAALVKSMDMNLTQDEVREIIKRSATTKEGSRNSKQYGYGVINARQALGVLSPSGLTLPTDPLVFGPEGLLHTVLNYPNPFKPKNESTGIYYSLTKTADIYIDIYSRGLQLVKSVTMLNESPGRKIVNWDGKDQSGDIVANGIYFVVFRAISGSTRVTQRHKIAVLQ